MNWAYLAKILLPILAIAGACAAGFEISVHSEWGHLHWEGSDHEAG